MTHKPKPTSGGKGEESDKPFVSRGGQKLAAALDAFGFDPRDLICADLGCNIGGFTDCLLRRGAKRIYAVDTGYGALAWTLRQDDRVVVMERTNALHVELPEPVQLITIDVAWTRQARVLPVALSLLATGGSIITLIKPHYEARREEVRGGVLEAERAPEVVERVRDNLAKEGMDLERVVESPIQGRKGNREFLALVRAPQSDGANKRTIL